MGSILIDGQKINFQKEKTILSLALENNIYIPHLCSRIGLPSPKGFKSTNIIYRGDKVYYGEEGIEYEGCGLCVIEIKGRNGFISSCTTFAEEGMVVSTNTPQLLRLREERIAHILKKHPHECLLCPEVRGCDRNICSIKIPEGERCCWKFGVCEIQRISEFIGIKGGLPPYKIHKEVVENPFFIIDYNYCVGCLRCIVACKEIAGAEALAFTKIEGEIIVGFKENTLNKANCKFCGICVEVCPTGTLRDKDIKMVSEKETILIPCRNTCPAGVNVPQYVQQISEGKFDESYQTILEDDPFPSILGRVCHSPCESVCRRGKLDEPVSIKYLKRSASFYNGKIKLFHKKRLRGKVAIIGLGPSGLSCGFYLSLMGYDITGYDLFPKAGGMLRVGIPPYRLPKDILDLELRKFDELEIKMYTGVKIESTDSLISEGYDAIFLGLGAHKSRKILIPGEESLVDGIEFLKKYNLSNRIDVGEKIGIIGGGNVAIDVARILIRENRRDITIFYRRTKEEMPAFREEIEAALDEGVKIEFQTIPLKIEKDGQIRVKFIKMRMSSEMDESGRRIALPIDGSEYWLLFDDVISAVGEVPDIPKGMKDLEEDGKIWINRETGMTKKKGVFAGGDVVTGPRTVVEAVKAGKKAALSIDRFLGGNGDFKCTKTTSYFKTHWQFNKGGRIYPKTLNLNDRLKGHQEVISVFTKGEAQKEASRCLRCSFRFMIPNAIYPPEKLIPFIENNLLNLPEEEGVYQLFDEGRNLYKVVGTENLRQSLLTEIRIKIPVKYFTYEKELMYTSKERQIIQQYLKENGKLPPGNDEIEELF